jgi:phospholipase/lecithinase/hemolysin
VTESSYTPSISQQVEKYLSDHGGKADPDALFILEGGANDIVHTTFTDPEELGRSIALGLFDSEQRLRQAGARHFIIAHLIDAGRLPVAAPIANLASAASRAANRHLQILLRADAHRGDMQILRLDMFGLLNAAVKDPAHFGFTNITDPCITTASVCPDPDHFFFFDDTHLSEFAQSDLAVAVETLLTARAEDDSFPDADR